MGGSNSKKKTKFVPPNLLYNLKAKAIDRSNPGYYNLATNRFNKNVKKELIVDEFYKVMGTQEELIGFYSINHITENMVCDIEKNTVLYAPNVDDVAKLPDAYLNSLCPFNLVGLQAKAKVVNILDYDTLDLAFFIPLKFFFEPKYYQHTRKSESKESESNFKQISLLKSSSPTSKKIQEGGLFVMMNCRLMGVDAAESNVSEQGRLATTLMTEKLKKLNNIVYMNSLGQDKYGRLLCDLYEDMERTKYINDFLIGYKDPKLGTLVLPYGGGTKSAEFANLPVVRK